jgi:hypothetical protein
LGGLLLVLGLVVVLVCVAFSSLPESLRIVIAFALGVVPIVVGAAVLWSGMRSAARRHDPEAERLAATKDQLVWRAMAQGGRITAAQASAHSGLAPAEAELALMALVAEGQATVEPGDQGDIVYRIDSPVGGRGR